MFVSRKNFRIQQKPRKGKTCSIEKRHEMALFVCSTEFGGRQLRIPFNFYMTSETTRVEQINVEVSKFPGRFYSTIRQVYPIVKSFALPSPYCTVLPATRPEKHSVSLRRALRVFIVFSPHSPVKANRLSVLT